MRKNNLIILIALVTVSNFYSCSVFLLPNKLKNVQNTKILPNDDGIIIRKIKLSKHLPDTSLLVSLVKSDHSKKTDTTTTTNKDTSGNAEINNSLNKLRNSLIDFDLALNDLGLKSGLHKSLKLPEQTIVKPKMFANQANNSNEISIYWLLIPVISGLLLICFHNKLFK